MTALWLLVAAGLLALPTHRPRSDRPPLRGRPPRPGHVARRPSASLLRGAAAAGAAAIAVGLVGGAAGVVAAVVGAALVWQQLPRLVARAGAADPLERARMPLVLDLVATVLRTGQPIEAALNAGRPAAGPVLREQLRQVSGLLRLGAGSTDAWATLAADARLRPMAVVAMRSAHSGIKLAAGWSALADELRAEALATATQRAARAGTWIIAPLGLCFLPAFVCLGIAPVVIGIGTGLLTGSPLP